MLGHKKKQDMFIKSWSSYNNISEKNNQARQFFPILLLFRMKENLRTLTDPFSLATVRMSSSKCIFHFVSRQTALVWTSSVNLNYIQHLLKRCNSFSDSNCLYLVLAGEADRRNMHGGKLQLCGRSIHCTPHICPLGGVCNPPVPPTPCLCSCQSRTFSNNPLGSTQQWLW